MADDFCVSMILFPLAMRAVCPTTTRVGGRKRTCFPRRCPRART